MVHAALAAFLGAGALTGPAVRAELALSPRSYNAVALQKDGTVTGAELDRLTVAVQAESAAPGQPIVVLVHGFALKQQDAAQSFETVAKRLREQAQEAGLPLSVVGVHWASDAGAPGEWLPKAVGSRFASLLGLKKAVRNPYLEKAEVAEASGRQGLRSVLFRLQDRFPRSPVHLWVHSMGAQVALSALAPEAAKADEKAEQPERELSVGMVTLAGADLDYDVFCRKETEAVRRALDRAQVWWVTKPEKDQADAVLELRRGAGRGDALGNRGLKLDRRELDLLLNRRALVMDEGNVPVKHDIESYYCVARVRELVRSMSYLQQPESAAGRQSVLASLDNLLHADDQAATVNVDRSASARLYAEWRQNPSATKLTGVALNRRGDEPRYKVASYRQATR